MMESEEECKLVGILPDGSLTIRIRGMEQKVQIHGVEIPYPPPDLYVEIITRRLPRLRKSLKCVVRSSEPGESVEVQFWYYGWQDKSGEVWLDLAMTLIEEGLVRVATGDFPERDEYLRHQQRARSSGLGIWKENKP
jgi:hypothetical protein